MTPTITVEKRTVAALIPYARNARLHDDAHVAQLAASLKEWGWTFPILIDEQDGIIAGHGRVLPARMLQLGDGPVTRGRGSSEAQERAYIIAENKLALRARWDSALRATELSDRRDLFAVDLIGFNAAALATRFKNG